PADLCQLLATHRSVVPGHGRDRQPPLHQTAENNPGRHRGRFGPGGDRLGTREAAQPASEAIRDYASGCASHAWAGRLCRLTSADWPRAALATRRIATLAAGAAGGDRAGAFFSVTSGRLDHPSSVGAPKRLWGVAALSARSAT